MDEDLDNLLKGFKSFCHLIYRFLMRICLAMAKLGSDLQKGQKKEGEIVKSLGVFPSLKETEKRIGDVF